jgi:CHAT domain-containing protein
VHLCAHGANTPGSPLFHHLLVTPGTEGGGRICAYELLGQDLRGLDVLSLGSCDSALGRFDAGDNLSGLPAAFLAAGASTLVAALWELLDEAATRFFVGFHRALKAGTPRLDAFRTAQLDVRAAFPQARDWAAFCYLGDWDREVQPLPADIPVRFELGSRAVRP